MNIVNVGYDSTNYYLLGTGESYLLIDAGWPGTLPKLVNACKRKSISLQQIEHLLVTHYHPDHAGLAQELKARGARLIVMESQVKAIGLMARYIKPEQHFTEIDLRDNINLLFAESRDFLRNVGLQGQIIATPGHSDDSVTLVLDEGLAFTGDLSMPKSDDPEDPTRKSWARIRALGVNTVYPAHGPVRPMG
jgi:ribonuclease/clavin/mitogillin